VELRDYVFFKELLPREYERLEAEAEKVRMEPGEMLYYQGEACERILFLQKGRIKVYMQPDDISAREMLLYELAPGEQCLVNTISTIGQSRTLASAVALEGVEAWAFSRDAILWLLNNSPAYRDFKIDLCQKRLASLIGLIASLKFDPIEQRIMNWLYVQGREVVEISHANLAETLGVSRESVSRNLKKLEKARYIELGYRLIIVRLA